MEVTFDDSIVTPHQAAAAGRIEQLIRTKAKYDRSVHASEGNGPCVEFLIATKETGLDVRLVLYQDSFHILANAAEVRIELDPDQYEAWIASSVQATSLLFEAPLCIRTRRTIVRRHTVGAIRIGSTWSGELLAARGYGAVHTFEDWYIPAAA